LRLRYKQMRLTAGKEYRLKASDAIVQKLINDSNIKAAKTVMTYISMGAEPNTHHFTERLLAEGKKIAAPVVFGKNMKASYITSLSNLKKSGYGALEPSGKLFRECAPTDIDIIIVPGIAFDKNGYRVGYGGGYYDKYLPLTNAVKIGICFDFCIVDNVYAQPHDVAVDYVVTDLREIM